MSGACFLGFTDGQIEIITEGKMDGIIVVPKEEHKDAKQFDIFFKLNGKDRVLEEFSTTEKNTISHRGFALENLIKILRESK